MTDPAGEVRLPWAPSTYGQPPPPKPRFGTYWLSIVSLVGFANATRWFLAGWTQRRQFRRLGYTSERVIEIPAARKFVEETRSLRLLQLGNVLHGAGTVVDKYEAAPGVLNVDVFDLEGSWDAGLSVSTLEHIGWDEPDHVPAFRKALGHFATLIRGPLFFTVPLGYNPEVDAFVREGHPGFSAEFFRRVGFRNRWVPIAKPEFRRFNWRYAGAEEVAFFRRAA